MTSVTPTKRRKLENDKIAESGFHEESDFSRSLKTSDFSLPPVKRKSLATRRVSLISLNSTTDSTQQSSGYSSLFSSSSNATGSSSCLAINSAAAATSRTSRTPKKRKSEISESDENFYNSFQFVSPVKIRKRDAGDKNCAKLVLKEKSSSENVILCSTPIRTNNKNARWGKFRSLHPEKFAIGKSIDDDAEAIEEKDEKTAVTPPRSSLATEGTPSFNLSNLELSNLSCGNFTSQDIPANLENLWTDDIKHSKFVSFSTTESQVIEQVKSTSATSERRKFYNGRIKLDILGNLHANHDIAVDKILNLLDAETLLSLSHVSSDYRHMIQTNKNYETKRLNYLKKHRAIKENKLPSRPKQVPPPAASDDAENTLQTIVDGEKKRKKAFGNYNLNKTIKHKTPSPPQSPSSRRFNTIQKIASKDKTKSFKHCPRCRKPAVVKSIKIRNSPRKKKPSSTIYKLSMSSTSGRVQKRSRAFLSKTSIQGSFHEAVGPHYVTISNFEEELSKSPDRSSCDSPSSSSSDDSCESYEVYEFGICTGVGCCYKFCIKCNCKYHPRQICGDLSPPSPSRSFNNSKILAGTKASRKSLRRLINY